MPTPTLIKYRQQYLSTTLLGLLLMLLSLFNSVVAIDYDFKHYTKADGLPSNYINDICQDSDGFIWIATRNGVCRYDGYDFKDYSTIIQPSGIPIPGFSQHVFEDKNQNIWVLGAGFYSYYYDGRDFLIASDEFTIGYPDKAGNIWFVNDSSLISVSINALKVDNNKSNKNALPLICKERNDEKWLFDSFDTKQLISASQGEINIYEYPKKEIRYIVRNLFVDSKGDIWLSTANNGVISFSPSTMQFKNYQSKYNSNSGLLNNNIFEIAEIENNRLWIGTKQGVNILDTDIEIFSYINYNKSIKNGLCDDVVVSFHKTDDGTVFVGTRYGLNILTEQKFKHIIKNESTNSLLSNNVHGFAQDKSDNIWIISSAGLDRYNYKTAQFKNFPINSDNNSLKGSPISIVTDENDNLWLGTWQRGVYFYNKSTQKFKHYNLNTDLNVIQGDNTAMSMFIDSEKNIWAGSWGQGLYLFDKNKDEFVLYYNDINNIINRDDVSVITEDKYNRIWVGTSEGVNIFKEMEPIPFKKFDIYGDSTLSNFNINAIEYIGKYMWVGTRRGLNRINIDDFSVEMFLISDGLPSNKIKSLTSDEAGSLWVGTDRGMAKIEFNNRVNQNIKHIEIYYEKDGLQGDDFLERSAFKARNGTLWFGGSNGFNTFLPLILVSDTTSVKPIFTSLLIDEKEVSMGDTIFGHVVLTKPLTKTESIILSYKQNSFSFGFAGLHFSNADKIEYRYMLEGFDETWKKSDYKNRTVVYTNINKGEYKLIVKTINKNSINASAPLVINIKVIPPWWETKLFFIISIILIIGVFVSIYLIRVMVLTKQKQQLESIVKQRTNDLMHTNTILEESREEALLRNEELIAINSRLEESREEIRQQNEGMAEINIRLEESHEEVQQQNERLGAVNLELEYSKRLIEKQNSELISNSGNLEKRIRIRTAELEDAKIKAEESDKLKSAFLANMSHEIRTPLNAIVGFSSLFKEGGLTDEEIDQYVDIIVNNSNALTTIINDIVDISMIEVNQLTLTRLHFNIDETLTELDNIYSLQTNKNVTVSFVKSSKPSVIFNDAMRLRQVLINLINNALKFTTEGHVKFGYKKDKDNVFFYVEDTGIGIADEFKDRIFKQFVKNAPDKGKFYGGTGLGLAISKNLIELMGGKIWFESEVDKGTIFWFTLPSIKACNNRKF